MGTFWVVLVFISGVSVGIAGASLYLSFAAVRQGRKIDALLQETEDDREPDWTRIEMMGRESRAAGTFDRSAGSSVPWDWPKREES